MESHPIPQQISSYQFRLVGDMTLKQFFQLGGGALFAILFYASHLIPIVKWPLVIFSFALGAALAFLPFEERPLSRWIVSFFSSIYSPTIFNWKKTEVLPTFFQAETTPQIVTVTPAPPAIPVAKLEQNEQGFLEKIGALFNQIPQPAVKPAVKQPAKQPLTIPVQEKVSSSQPGSGYRPKIVVEEKTFSTTATEGVLKTSAPLDSQQAQFSPEAGPPIPPSIPNTISGQVLSDENKIVEGAILEVRDLAGRPVRALRSNKVGHFLIVTALQDGQYDIITEKESFTFDPITFEARGEIIPPIVIKAKSHTEVKNVPYAGKPLIIN